MGKNYKADKFEIKGGTDDTVLLGDGTLGSVSNWNTAFGWGDHASQGYATSSSLSYRTDAEIEAIVESYGYIDAETDNQSLSISGNTISLTSGGSVVVPDNDTIYTHPTSPSANVNTSGATIINTISTNMTGHVTNLGTRTLSLGDLGYTGDADANNYVLPFTDNSANWDTAFGWGDHELSAQDKIDIGNLSGTNTGDQDLSGYALTSHNHIIADVTGLQTALDGKVDDAQVLTDVPSGALFTDTVYTLPFTDNSANWDTAFGWGDHELSAQDKIDIGNLSGTNTGDQDFGYELVTSASDFNDLVSGNVANENWLIVNDVALDGNKTLPTGTRLFFNGGVISGAFTLTGQGAFASSNGAAFNTDVVLDGSWVSEFTPYMFGAKGDLVSNDTLSIQKCIDVSAAVKGKMVMIGNFLSDTLTFGDGSVTSTDDDVEIETLCTIQSINDVDMWVIDGCRVKHTGSLTLRGTSRIGTSRNIVIKNGSKGSYFDKVYLQNTSLGLDYEDIGNNNGITWNFIECRELSKTYRAEYTKTGVVSASNIFNIGRITTTDTLNTKVGHIVVQGKTYPIVAEPGVSNSYFVGGYANMPDYDSDPNNKLWHYTGGGILHQRHPDNGAIEYKTLNIVSLDGSSITVQAQYGVTVNGGEIEGNANNVVVGGIYMNGSVPTPMLSIRSTFMGLHTEANVANEPLVYTSAKSNVVFEGCMMANGVRVGAPEVGVRFHSWRGSDRLSNVYYGSIPDNDVFIIRPINPEFVVYRDMTLAPSLQLDLNDLVPDMEYMGDTRINYTVKGEVNLLNIPVGTTRTLVINGGGAQVTNTINGGTSDSITITGSAEKTINKITFLLKGSDFTFYTDEEGAKTDLVVNDSLTSNGAIIVNEDIEALRFNTTETQGGTFMTWRKAGAVLKGIFGFAETTSDDLYFANYETGMIRMGTNGRLDDLVIGTTGDVSFPNGVFNTKGYTVATLPTGVTGQTAYVTDATTPTYLSAIVGGGSVLCPVFFNGTIWVSH